MKLFYTRQQVQEKSAICYLCLGAIDFTREWHIDHSIPRSQGGVDELWNLFPTHPNCNVLKGTKKASTIQKKIKEMTNNQKKKLRYQRPSTKKIWPILNDWVPEINQTITESNEVSF